MPESSSPEIVNQIADAISFLGDRLRVGHPMAPLCTYRVGGSADLFTTVDDVGQLRAIADALAGVPGLDPSLGMVHVVGRGSNLLVADAGVRGLVIQLGAGFDDLGLVDGSGVSTEGTDEVIAGAAESVMVHLGAGLSMPVAARRIAALGLTGFEWAVGIPGSVGGAVRMNAGGHGSDLSQVLVRVHLIDLLTGEALWVNATDLHLGYRSSSLRDHQVVTDVEIRLRVGDAESSGRALSEIVRWRREHQPGGANAGSVFTNPPGDSAGRLIDDAGCRGMRIGTAEVSPKHANFIQADPGGSADDVMALMRHVVDRVRAQHGIVLHAETVLLGFEADDVAAVKGTAPGAGT